GYVYLFIFNNLIIGNKNKACFSLFRYENYTVLLLKTQNWLNNVILLILREFPEKSFFCRKHFGTENFMCIIFATFSPL
ncbi:hypothetical protein BpHYR1_018260, partial [Brachionus plicatilis]